MSELLGRQLAFGFYDLEARTAQLDVWVQDYLKLSQIKKEFLEQASDFRDELVLNGVINSNLLHEHTIRPAVPLRGDFAFEAGLWLPLAAKVMGISVRDMSEEAHMQYIAARRLRVQKEETAKSGYENIKPKSEFL